MKSSDVSPARCIHCLKITKIPELDHVFPKSWYPDSTPPTVQRWTVPSCPDCNRNFGKLERELLIRLILCTDPKSPASAGLDAKVFRTLGIDTKDLPAGEQAIRDLLRAKIRSELMHDVDLATMPGRIPGMGPQDHERQGPAIFIPYAGLSMMIEKIARGFEYKFTKQKRLIEQPYEVLTIINHASGPPAHMAEFSQEIDFGPGLRVSRTTLPDGDPLAVAYSMTIWEALNFTALIDSEENLEVIKSELSRADGVLPESGAAMEVPDYLRRYTIEVV